ncbi:hypothetical protein IQ07DRAFT_333930 [Pyrenochaeta sp. DS3sAY3a]|nr:hypothetical protein IQ07DRAFT_333930 [Pyrenochaeta sp. DS3sAY3a]
MSPGRRVRVRVQQINAYINSKFEFTIISESYTLQYSFATAKVTYFIMSDTAALLDLPLELLHKILEQCIGEEDENYVTLSRRSPDCKASGPKILPELQTHGKIYFELKKILHTKKIIRIRSDNLTPVFVLGTLCGFWFRKICFSHYSCIALLTWLPQWAGGNEDQNWPTLDLHREFFRQVAHAPRGAIGFDNNRMINNVKTSLCDSMEHLCKKMPALNHLELGIDVLELLPKELSFGAAVHKFLHTEPENYDLTDMGEIIEEPWKFLFNHKNIEDMTICIVWKRFLEQRLRTGGFAFNPLLTDALRQQLQAKAKDLLSYFYWPHQYDAKKQEMAATEEASDAKGKGKALAAPSADTGPRPNHRFRTGRRLKELVCREATEVDELPEPISGAGEGDGVSQDGASAQQG